MSRIDRLDGGMDTARVTASEQDRIHREQRQADALAYLTRKGLDDVAEILGLTPSPKPKREPRKHARKTPTQES
ncbi:hypothetical protein [Micromonospora sp. NPDC047730]|uniref:hypothetical protein n=1 Tax=Micromonospora sp. NPDC047730 TaxID=3364253 RepID=UPI003721D3BA